MSIVLKLQSSLLIWMLANMEFPSSSLPFLHGEFHLFTWPSSQENEKSRSKVPPKDILWLRCKWFKMPLCPRNWLQMTLIKVIKHILKWGTPHYYKGAVPHVHACSHHGTTVYTKLFFFKSHLLTWPLRWRGLSPSSRWKSSFQKTHMKVQSFRHWILLQRKEDNSRGRSQCLEGCAAMLVWLVTVTLKE